MPRPRKSRLVGRQPTVDYFKPRGVPLSQLTEVYLPVEGYEALRLADIEGLSQEEAAGRMNVSRHTFGRVLAEARRVVAEAVIKGLALRIEGGHYAIREACGAAGGICSWTLDAGKGPRMKSAADTPSGPAGLSSREKKMDKIAVSSQGPTLEDRVDPRFGRAAGFLVVDAQTREHTYLDNGAAQTRAQGAGIQAAELVAKAGVKTVLSGFVGPKAFQALAAAGIQVGEVAEGITVQEALERFAQGQVKIIAAPNRQGHWR